MLVHSVCLVLRNNYFKIDNIFMLVTWSDLVAMVTMQVVLVPNAIFIPVDVSKQTMDFETKYR